MAPGAPATLDENRPTEQVEWLLGAARAGLAVTTPASVSVASVVTTILVRIGTPRSESTWPSGRGGRVPGTEHAVRRFRKSPRGMSARWAGAECREALAVH